MFRRMESHGQAPTAMTTRLVAVEASRIMKLIPPQE